MDAEIVKLSDIAKGFELLPRRWAVARTFAGLIVAVAAEGFEATTVGAVSWVYIFSTLNAYAVIGKV